MGLFIGYLWRPDVKCLGYYWQIVIIGYTIFDAFKIKPNPSIMILCKQYALSLSLSLALSLSQFSGALGFLGALPT